MSKKFAGYALIMLSVWQSFILSSRAADTAPKFAIKPTELQAAFNKRAESDRITLKLDSPNVIADTFTCMAGRSTIITGNIDATDSKIRSMRVTVTKENLSADTRIRHFNMIVTILTRSIDPSVVDHSAPISSIDAPSPTGEHNVITTKKAKITVSWVGSDASTLSAFFEPL